MLAQARWGAATPEDLSRALAAVRAARAVLAGRPVRAADVRAIGAWLRARS